MSNTQDETTMEKLEARLVELERANARLSEELVALRAERPFSTDLVEVHTQENVPRRSQAADRKAKKGERRSRRRVLQKALIAAAAAMGAATLSEMSGGTAYANGDEGPTHFSGSGLGTIVVQVDATKQATGIFVTSDDHDAIEASTFSGFGVIGSSHEAFGVLGGSVNSVGVFADVSGAPIVAPLPGPVALLARGGPHNAIEARSDSATGVFATSDSGLGILAQSTSNAGILATSDSAAGVVGQSTSNSGIVGSSASAPGVLGLSSSGAGVEGSTISAPGVFGSSDSDYGVFGVSRNGPGVGGESTSNYGVHAVGGGASRSAGPGAAGVFAEGGPNYGVYATSSSGTGLYTTSTSGPALVASGHVQVQGDAVGTAKLLAGTTSVTVTTTAATLSSNVLLTPLANPKAHLWVTRAADSFTIHTSAAPTKDVPIAYLIMN